MIAGGLLGFTSMYLLFFWGIQKYCIHYRAMSENKYAHYIRQEYINQFPNTEKAKMYAKFGFILREKYDFSKY